MKVSTIKKALIEQKKINLSGNIYYKTQLDFAYNPNHMEDSTIPPSTKPKTISPYSNTC